MRGVRANSWNCHIRLQLVEARSATTLEARGHHADPEAIAALRWINRRLAGEDHLAELHARARIRAHD